MHITITKTADKGRAWRRSDADL